MKYKLPVYRYIRTKCKSLDHRATFSKISSPNSFWSLPDVTGTCKCCGSDNMMCCVINKQQTLLWRWLDCKQQACGLPPCATTSVQQQLRVISEKSAGNFRLPSTSLTGGHKEQVTNPMTEDLTKSFFGGFESDLSNRLFLMYIEECGDDLLCQLLVCC